MAPPPPHRPGALPGDLSSRSLGDSKGTPEMSRAVLRPRSTLPGHSCLLTLGQEARGLSLWPPHNTSQK